MAAVLDASAVLAVAFCEPGADVVQEHMAEARLTVVNWCEALGRWRQRGRAATDLGLMLAESGVRLEPVTPGDAGAAAELLAAHPSAGLSLGDRFCLATARRLQRPVLTADRRWAEVEHGVEVLVIR